MKRHKALHGLSSEHHHGLVWARRLEKAAKEQNSESASKELVDGFLVFWESDLYHHFRKEEDLLFPVYFTCAEGPTDSVMETLRQHVVIRGKIFQLQEAAKSELVSTELLKETSELLNAHVRFEERTLFEEIQENCSEVQLRKLAAFPELQKAGDS